MVDKILAVLYFLLGDNLIKDFKPIIEEYLGVVIKEELSLDTLNKINEKIYTLIPHLVLRINTDIISVEHYVKIDGMFVDEKKDATDVIPKPYIVTDGSKSNYFFIFLVSDDFKDSLKIKWKYENFDLESILIGDEVGKKIKSDTGYVTYHKLNGEWYLYANGEDKKIKYIKKGDYIFFDTIKFKRKYTITTIYKKQRNDKQDYINYKCLCSDTYGWVNEDAKGSGGGICWFVSIMMILLLHPDMRKITLEKLQKKSKMDVSKLFACKETKTSEEREKFFISIVGNKRVFSFDDPEPINIIMNIIEPRIYKRIIPQVVFRIRYKDNNNSYIKEIKEKVNPNGKIFALIVIKDPHVTIDIFENIKGYKLMGVGVSYPEKVLLDVPVDIMSSSMIEKYDDKINKIQETNDSPFINIGAGRGYTGLFESLGHFIAFIRCGDDNWYLYDDNRNYAMERMSTSVVNNVLTFKRQKYKVCGEKECRVADYIHTPELVLFYLKV